MGNIEGYTKKNMKKKSKKEDKGQTSLTSELEKIEVAKEFSDTLRKLPTKKALRPKNDTFL